jgi:hypothetical protein
VQYLQANTASAWYTPGDLQRRPAVPARAIVVDRLVALVGHDRAAVVSPVPSPRSVGSPLTVAAAGETCLRLSEIRRVLSASEAPAPKLRRASCDMALAAEPDNLRCRGGARPAVTPGGEARDAARGGRTGTPGVFRDL